MVAPVKPPRIPESAVQRHIVATARTVGGEVWELGTKRSKRDFDMGTHQTPGVPDLIIFLPPVKPGVRWLLVFVEAKAKGGRMRTEQRRFRELCIFAQQHHVVGGLDEFIAFLIRHAYLKPENVPHYRLPAEAR